MPLPPIRQHADITIIGLLRALMEVSRKLLLSFGQNTRGIQAPLYFDDSVTSFDIDAPLRTVPQLRLHLHISYLPFNDVEARA